MSLLCFMRQPMEVHHVLRHFLYISSSVKQLKQIHAFLHKTSTKPIQRQSYLSALFVKLLQLPGDNLSYARNLFDRIPHRKNRFLWTSFLRSHVALDHLNKAVSLYAEMYNSGVPPCGFAFSLVLSSCARLTTLPFGKQVHARVWQSGFLSNKIVTTSLLDMYGKNGGVVEARLVFDEIEEKDVVARTAMIGVYCKSGFVADARKLFDAMEERNVVSWTTMVAGYANRGDMGPAEELYGKIPKKNAVTWVAMIAGYGKVGEVAKAREIFDDADAEDAACGAAMVACYAQNGRAKEALDVYIDMRERGVVITEVAIVGAVSACTQLADIAMAEELAEHVDQGRCGQRSLFVSNALIHMHSKCGNIDRARKEFDTMKIRDVVSYSSMIGAHTDHGNPTEALDLFHTMLRRGINPNAVTFVTILGLCSHQGLVNEACRYFDAMVRVYGIKPSVEHYTSMVDLLGRAGQLERAYRILADRPELCEAGALGALLGACRTHGNIELGEVVAAKLFEIEPENTGNYTILANLHKSVCRWEDAERVRKLMRTRGMKKSPGISSI